MLALRSAPVPIRFALAALSLLLVLYTAELAFHFLPGERRRGLQEVRKRLHHPELRGTLRRARAPGPGRACARGC